MTVRVPAKVNLQLAVGPLRADGYHELVTVFHAISLFDEVTVRPADRTTVRVTGEDAAAVPAGRANLAVQAAAALARAGRPPGRGGPAAVLPPGAAPQARGAWPGGRWRSRSASASR